MVVKKTFRYSNVLFYNHLYHPFRISEFIFEKRYIRISTPFRVIFKIMPADIQKDAALQWMALMPDTNNGELKTEGKYRFSAWLRVHTEGSLVETHNLAR